MRFKALWIAGLMFAATAGQVQAAFVTATNDGNALANAILGPGVTIVGPVNYSGANSAASGTFTNGGNLGIESGIVMTTGNAIGAEGPNNTGSYSGSGATTTLEFSFTTASNDLFFNYIFASEEYNEFVGSTFNDAFSLLLDGVNIALVPSTSTPITINNVNNGLNSAYFRDNTSGAYDTQYDGLTTVLTAQALGLAPGVHQIIMTISDVGDSSYDSGVFIQAGTFSSDLTSVPEPASTVMWSLGALGSVFGARRKRRTTKLAA